MGSEEKDVFDNMQRPIDQAPLDQRGDEIPGGPVDLAALQADYLAMKDQLLRAVAETENTRRRLTRERDETAKYAASSFAKEMLDVADNLHRALAAIPAEAVARDEALKSLFDGVSATERQLDAAFTRQQIKRLWPEGEKFDSNLHQAMFEVPGTDQPNGTVVQVLQAGYVMHDRLLRPALVGVAKNDQKGSDPKPAGDASGHVDTVA
ncbi:MAG: nucleotide exchange factor GrpE [Rhodospirillaceae bacterium]|nr:nucleotide exchange factor GrpE [Rhodospirillaceae bacterium]